jgi:MOSC domain-containing protein YiiM
VIVRAVCTGQVRTLRDAEGEWSSAIFKEPAGGPVQLGLRGLEGDAVADARHHGTPDQAVCVLPAAHHAHWGAQLGRAFGPGAFGENWVLDDADEHDVCIGDVWRVGSAQVEVTQPRIPCWKQARKLGVPGLERQIAHSGRTGFYLRVLAPGMVTAGDAIELLARPNPGATIAQVNAALEPDADPDLLAVLVEIPQLAAGWRARFRKRLNAR